MMQPQGAGGRGRPYRRPSEGAGALRDPSPAAEAVRNLPPLSARGGPSGGFGGAGAPVAGQPRSARGSPLHSPHEGGGGQMRRPSVGAAGRSPSPARGGYAVGAPGGVLPQRRPSQPLHSPPPAALGGGGHVDSGSASAIEHAAAALAPPPEGEPRKRKHRKARIKVVVRKRPLSQKEGGEDCVEMDTGAAQCRLNAMKQRVDLSEYVESHDFAFDAAFGEKNTTAELYESCARELIDCVFEGGSASCFAYGQTGSGKTHTMIGNDSEPGLYIMAANDIFRRIQPPQHRVFVSLFEIYCNSLFDLLNGRAVVVAREDANKRVNICGLTWHEIESVDELRSVMDHGAIQRRTGSTSANEFSSRSHAILTITVRDETQPRFLGSLNVVDLAGSERAADTAANDKQTRLEGAEINKSLLALKECIRGLDERKKHVPFRGSKLTEVLRDSFVGNSRTVMVATLSPATTNAEHTLNTLRYAFRVKGLSIQSPQPSNARALQPRSKSVEPYLAGGGGGFGPPQVGADPSAVSAEGYPFGRGRDRSEKRKKKKKDREHRSRRDVPSPAPSGFPIGGHGAGGGGAGRTPGGGALSPPPLGPMGAGPAAVASAAAAAAEAAEVRRVEQRMRDELIGLRREMQQLRQRDVDAIERLQKENATMRQQVERIAELYTAALQAPSAAAGARLPPIGGGLGRPGSRSGACSPVLDPRAVAGAAGDSASSSKSSPVGAGAGGRVNGQAGLGPLGRHSITSENPFDPSPLGSQLGSQLSGAPVPPSGGGGGGGGSPGGPARRRSSMRLAPLPDQHGTTAGAGADNAARGSSPAAVGATQRPGDSSSNAANSRDAVPAPGRRHSRTGSMSPSPPPPGAGAPRRSLSNVGNVSAGAARRASAALVNAAARQPVGADASDDEVY